MALINNRGKYYEKENFCYNMANHYNMDNKPYNIYNDKSQQ